MEPTEISESPVVIEAPEVDLLQTINAKMARRVNKSHIPNISDEKYAEAAASETFIVLVEMPIGTAYPTRKRLAPVAAEKGVLLEAIQQKGKAYLIGCKLPEAEAEVKTEAEAEAEAV